MPLVDGEIAAESSGWPAALARFVCASEASALDCVADDAGRVAASFVHEYVANTAISKNTAHKASA